jgi:ethanolamine utilization cobalamin adenosyltransferase
MLFSEENVKANIRNREGKRVFYLGSGDTLTPSARDLLQRERIEILPSHMAKPEEYRLENGAILTEKPEHYTHLRGNVLVPKTHPVIAFRGAMDSLQAELLLSQQAAPETLRKDIGEILTLARNILRWDVMEEPARVDKLCGLTTDELRSHSHRPQEYYGQPHFMPEYTDGPALLQLNRARCAARSAELSAVRAFTDGSGICRREDILQVLNRMSSMLYILMIRLKAGR